MAARTYKRDSNGRFASGSGGSSGGGKSAAKKTAASKPAAKKPAAAKPAASKPATDGRRGPRGGKTGTRAEQRKAAAAQAARSAEFRGKATAGRGAKDAYKAAARGARISEKGAAKKVVQATAKSTAKRQKPKAVRITNDKIDRIAGRINNVVNNRSGRTGVKALNAIQVGVRAKDFFSRKAGGVEKFNALPRDQKEASARSALTKPPRYSTQRPNRNKPGRFNELGQDRVRATKARLAAQQAAAKPAATPAATPKPAARPAAPKSFKLDAMQRSEAAYAKRKYGVRSTISNPGRRSRRGRMVTTSSGARVMTTGRTRSQAGASQARRTRRLLTDMNSSGSRVRRVKKLPQMNVFGGADVGTYLKPAAKGPKRRIKTMTKMGIPVGRYS